MATCVFPRLLAFGNGACISGIGRIYDVDPLAVSCPMMGEHGENVAPVVSHATVYGEPVELTAEQRQQVLDYVRDVPYDVMSERDPDEFSRWASGRGAASIVNALQMAGRTRRFVSPFPWTASTAILMSVSVSPSSFQRRGGIRSKTGRCRSGRSPRSMRRTIISLHLLSNSE